ncbi:hypothetical protein [Parvibaculum sp. MBR-TMA-1.3b-4.2]|jgi:hypothetical protein
MNLESIKRISEAAEELDDIRRARGRLLQAQENEEALNLATLPQIWFTADRYVIGAIDAQLVARQKEIVETLTELGVELSEDERSLPIFPRLGGLPGDCS